MDNNTFEALQSTTAASMMTSPAGIVRGGASVWEVVERFLSGPARHVVVVDPSGRYIGIIGTRHLAGLWPLDAKQLKATPVEALGCAAWISLRRDDDLRTCARALTEYDLDAVPVLDEENHVVGVVTARAIARAVSDCAQHQYPVWQE
ncbi:MAG: CBS domain-containing protein [Actinocrinis sp.]